MKQGLDIVLCSVAHDGKRWFSRANLQSMLFRYRSELILFAVLWVLYSILALMVLQTGLLTSPLGERYSGSFLGYDNYDRFLNRGGLLDVSHPLVLPFQALRAVVLMRILGPELNLLLMVLLMVAFVAASNVGVYAYCRHIVGLNGLWSAFLVGLTIFSFTSLTLCFTVESYPQSMFLLVASLCALSRDKVRYGYYRKRTVWGFSFLAGGLTLTNVAKPASAFLVDRDLRQGIRKLTSLAIVFTLTCGMVVLTYMLRDCIFKGLSPWRVFDGVQDLAQFIENPVKQDAFAAFFGQSLIISDLGTVSLYNEEVLRPLPYSSWLYYVPAIVAALLMLGGMVRGGHKYPIARLLPAYLCVDLVVNVLLRYGLNEAIIFGGHWVFLLPMSVAFLIRDAGKIERRVYASAIAIVVSVMVTHNIPIVLNAFVCVSG